MRHLNDQTAPILQQEIGNYRSRLCGLSLARQLVRTEKTSSIKACLYGPVSPAATNRHSWGFWATQGLKEQTELARQRWHKWQIITAERKVTQTADLHPYCRLDSRDWLTIV